MEILYLWGYFLFCLLIDNFFFSGFEIELRFDLKTSEIFIPFYMAYKQKLCF